MPHCRYATALQKESIGVGYIPHVTSCIYCYFKAQWCEQRGLSTVCIQQTFSCQNPAFLVSYNLQCVYKVMNGSVFHYDSLGTDSEVNHFGWHSISCAWHLMQNYGGSLLLKYWEIFCSHVASMMYKNHKKLEYCVAYCAVKILYCKNFNEIN